MHDAKAWRESGLAQRSKAACMLTADQEVSPTPPTPAPDCAYLTANPKASL